jgi:hypothetical protein
MSFIMLLTLSTALSKVWKLHSKSNFREIWGVAFTKLHKLIMILISVDVPYTNKDHDILGETFVVKATLP